MPAVAVDPRLPDPRLPLDVLAAALALNVWVASGSLVLAIANGLGEHPVRRIAIGAALVGASAFMLWQRDGVATLLRARPWLVLALGTAALGAAAIDGVIGGAYVAFSLSAVGIATIVARARTVWLCVALLEVLYAIAVLAAWSPAALAEQGQLGHALGAMVSYPVTAWVFLWLRARFTVFMGCVDATLADIRDGTPAFTLALGQAIADVPPQLTAGPPVRLTTTERMVVEALAAGRAAKELAHAWDVSLHTVRTHIKNAKRKTGARTLRELAALPSRADWR